MQTLELLFQIFTLHPIFWSLLIFFGVIIETWVHFGFIMRLQMLRKIGKLNFKEHPVRFIIAYFVLYFIGFPLDVSTNILFSPMFLELPQWHKGEILLTQRLCRHYEPGSDNWRSKRAYWIGEEFLNDVDPSGQHVK